MTDREATLEDVLRAAVAFQRLVPDAILVGGTAVAMQAGHRRSLDADHVLGNLKQRFADLLEMLEARAEWTTARVRPPHLILGNFCGVETGLRQLMRTTPLETECVKTAEGLLQVPSRGELLRIKGWLILQRNAVRDYIDFAALSQHMGDGETLSATRDFDRHYSDIYQQGQQRDVSPLLQLMRQLADPQPYDLSEVDVPRYKGIVKPWDRWEKIAQRCQEVSLLLADALVRGCF